MSHAGIAVGPWGDLRLDPFGQLATVSVVAGDERPELRDALPEPITQGVLILNLRAETDPRMLAEVVSSTVAEGEGSGNGITLTVEHQESFRPARPVPTHRISVEEGGCHAAEMP